MIVLFYLCSNCAFVYYLLTDLYRKKELPKLEQLETRMRTDKLVYTIFLERFVSCIVGKDKFRRSSCLKALSGYTTVSDEAMAFLILANNYAVWEEGADLMMSGCDVVSVEQLKSKQAYFKEGKGRGRSWSEEGKQYYNKMYEQVKLDRVNNGEKFDEFFLGRMRGEDESEKQRKRDQRKSNASLNKDVVRCRHDFQESLMDDLMEDDDGKVIESVGI